MDRHVIKGRRANRGKYLCWARGAPREKPSEDGFVWLPEQRKALACYWFDAAFHESGENFCWKCAVKLVDQKYAQDPKRFEEVCGECEDAEERYRAAIDGGFDIQHDSLPWCEKCGAKLSGLLTEYGADQEIEAYTDGRTVGFDEAEDWDALDRAIVNVSDDDPRWRKIAKVVEAARAAEQAQARITLLSILAARAAQNLKGTETV